MKILTISYYRLKTRCYPELLCLLFVKTCSYLWQYMSVFGGVLICMSINCFIYLWVLYFFFLYNRLFVKRKQKYKNKFFRVPYSTNSVCYAFVYGYIYLCIVIELEERFFVIFEDTCTYDIVNQICANFRPNIDYCNN